MGLHSKLFHESLDGVATFCSADKDEGRISQLIPSPSLHMEKKTTKLENEYNVLELMATLKAYMEKSDQ